MPVPALTLRAGLIGHPVAHSLSPALHTAAGRACGVQVEYTLHDVVPGEVGEQIDALRAAGLQGINATAPHKAAAYARAEVLTPAARAVGAVNTLIFGEQVVGDNTDVEGFARALGPPPGPRAVLIGAGGAARAVVYALQRADVESITVLNRRLNRAEQLVGELDDGRALLIAKPLSEAQGAIRGADLLVDCLPPSAAEVVAGLPFDVLSPTARIMTLVYGRNAARLRAAVGRMRAFDDGLGMLAWQGLAAFERWTGRRPPFGPVRDALAMAAARPD